MSTNPENVLVLEVLGKQIQIELLADTAPGHVERVKLLASEGFYDNCPFHRVIDGFMAQTGDGSNRDGTGGSGAAVPLKRVERRVAGISGLAATPRAAAINSSVAPTAGRAARGGGPRQHAVFRSPD